MLALGLSQAVEPSPSGWASTGERVVDMAHSKPEAFWPVVAVALPLIIVGGIGLIVWKAILPAWREEKKADRESLVTALRQRGEEAAKDAEKDRELVKTQHEMLIQRIEGKVERVTGELAKVDGRVTQELAKIDSRSERLGELLSPTRELNVRMDRLNTELQQLSALVQRIVSKIGILLLLLGALVLLLLLQDPGRPRPHAAHAAAWGPG